MKDLRLALLDVAVTVAKLCRPGGVRAVMSENLLLKQQLIVVGRSRRRAPNLRVGDRLLLGFLSLFLSPGRIRKVAIGVRPSTLRLSTKPWCAASTAARLFSSAGTPKKPGPKGPSEARIRAIVELKGPRRNNSSVFGEILADGWPTGRVCRLVRPLKSSVVATITGRGGRTIMIEDRL